MTSIFSWKCSFYNNKHKKWAYGNLEILYAGLVFKDDKSNLKVHIPFKHIHEIKTGKSSFIYRSLIAVIHSESLWFSSFKNLDAVYNIINHFMKEKLIGSAVPDQDIRSTREKKLLQIAQETETIMSNAAEQVYNQGVQLNQMNDRLNTIHNDITVTQRLTRDLDSWLGAWRCKNKFRCRYAMDGREDLQSNYNTKRKVFEVLAANVAQESHTTANLVFAGSRLEVVTLCDKSPTVNFFSSEVSQISEINTHSPCDLTLSLFVVGGKDKSIHIITTMLPDILAKLESEFNCCVSYDSPPPQCSVADQEGDNEIMLNLVNHGNKHDDKTNSKQPGDLTTTRASGSSLKQQQQEDLSDGAARELTSMICNIKSMALEVGFEQDAQLQQIDRISESVVIAGDRISATDWKVRKMT